MQESCNATKFIPESHRQLTKQIGGATTEIEWILLLTANDLCIIVDINNGFPNPFGSIPNGMFADITPNTTHRLGLTVLYEINLENTGLSDDTVTRDSFHGLESVRDVGNLS